MNNLPNTLQPILKDLQTTYTHLVSKLDKPQATDNPLSRKTISQLSNKIYTLIQMPNAQKDGKQNKEILLQVYRSHLTNYINNHIISSLIKCYDDGMFVESITIGWAHFKRFVFTYHTLLFHAKDYYEKQSSNAKKREPNKQASILPVSGLSLNLFSKMVVMRYESKIDRIVALLLQSERQRQNAEDGRLRVLLQMLWSCCLRDLGRMSMDKDGCIVFWREQNKVIVKDFKSEQDNQGLFLQRHLKLLTSCATIYYSALYWDKLNLLNAKQQVEYLDLVCRREQELSRFQMPSRPAAQYYLKQIRKALLCDLQGILSKPKGFKYIFVECSEHFEQVYALAMLYFSIFKYIQQGTMSVVCRVMGEALMQKGNQINSKMNKPRQYVILMLSFKKSVRRIFDSADTHCLQIEQTMQKTFKKLLDSLECTKNLAQYADFTIKQCIRLKLDDQGCESKFREILFLLMSVSAKDSFLLHYQQYLAKRLIQSLNQPRVDIENIMLRLIGQQLGNLTISHHLGMVKDIQKSIVSSQQIHNNLPFISYKWDLRVFNPACWPESTSRLRFTQIQPPKSIKMHSTIIQDLYLQHYGAKLKLKFDKGTSLFEGRFPTAKVKFQAENSYLMILLHLSDRRGMATMNQLRTLFKDKKEDFRTAPILHLIQVLLQSRLVIRNTTEGDLSQQEQVRINYDYKPPQGFKPQVPIIIKPSMSLIKLFKQSNIDENKIIRERQKLIDAMLVKLLKHANSTKGNRITFTQLFQGMKGNNFLANLDIPQSVVKQRLEYLIVKQFCKRNEDDRRIYHYIA